MTRKIRFTRNVDQYEEGMELECDSGIADAYVEWRKVAEYIDQPKRRDKMIRPADVKTKD